MYDRENSKNSYGQEFTGVATQAVRAQLQVGVSMHIYAAHIMLRIYTCSAHIHKFASHIHKFAACCTYTHVCIYSRVWC